MEQDPKEVKVYKDGELVATAVHVQKVNVPWPWVGVHKENKLALPDPTVFTCFHLPQVKLERILVFKVLNKMPLSSIFNGAGLEMDEERIEPVYYVRGVVETFRGNPNVTGVVLAQPSLPVSQMDFARILNELFKRFSLLLGKDA